MKATFVCLLALAAAVQLCEAAEFNYAITVHNAVGASQILKFGLDPAATDSIDAALGELERPPVPPSEIFDARFVGTDIGLANKLKEGLIEDYRYGEKNAAGTRIHEVAYQVGVGNTITIVWDFPNYLSGRLQDVVNGMIVDVMMAGKDSTVITNATAIVKLKMTLTYEAGLPITLAGFQAKTSESNNVILNWWTVSEINNYGFEVQKSLAKNSGFETIPSSFVPGAGTTLTRHDYSFEDPTTSPGAWYYRLKQTDLDGAVHYFEPVLFDVATAVSERSVPQEFQLCQNYPNPFNPSTIISGQLEADSRQPTADRRIRLVVYDVLGREVAVLEDGHIPAGKFSFIFDGTHCATGVYFYRLTAGNFTAVRKMTLVK